MPSHSSSPHVHMTARLLSRGVDDTRALGERVGRLCLPGDVILLEGPLGAGKTALAQGLARGLGVAGVVNSPTFTLVKEYAGRLPLYHVDLYRLDDASQAVDLGIEDYLDRQGVCVVEWAERAAEVWPVDHLRVRFTVTGPDERLLDLEGTGTRGAALCAQLAADGASHQSAPLGRDEAS
jgi:tRNA threonylcarbamoyladenosine biosynthesis protein TsaE